MRQEITQFEARHVQEAASLFAASYQRERRVSPLLPRRALDDKEWIARVISKSMSGAGAALCSGGALQGFMLATGPFSWKGQRCALVQEFCHASVEDGAREIYQLLYTSVAGQLAAQGVAVHLIGHFYGDAVLKNTLFDLGFGAIVMEELRGLDVVPGAAEGVAREDDFSVIEELNAEHCRYYQESPIFIPKEMDRETFPMGANALFVHRDAGAPTAYCFVGPCLGEEDGRLLQGTNTAQLLCAYAKPESRCRGVGKALLNASVLWAREGGFDRLYVEHESANIQGGNFWRRHFAPYLAFSMRYIDPQGLRPPRAS